MARQTRAAMRREQEARRAAEALANRALRLKAVGATERILCAEPGHVLQEAAPLVFAAMCRREGIRVFYSESPMTEGSSIWLGPIDITSPLARVFVYGHGCHERHHIRYTNFDVVRMVPPGGISRLFNIFEDIRIDALGSAEYAGYLLWREALFCAMESTGAAPWLASKERMPGRNFELWLLTLLECEVLGLERFRPVSERLEGDIKGYFCQSLIDSVRDEVLGAYPLRDTENALALARSVYAKMDHWGRLIEEKLLEMRAKLERQVMERTGKGAPKGNPDGRKGGGQSGGQPQRVPLTAYAGDEHMRALLEEIEKSGEPAIREVKTPRKPVYPWEEEGKLLPQTETPPAREASQPKVDGAAQGSLFDEQGEVVESALPECQMPGYAAVQNAVRGWRTFSLTTMKNATDEAAAELRRMISVRLEPGSMTEKGDRLLRAPTRRELLALGWNEDILDRHTISFYESWHKTASLTSAFQQALESHVHVPLIPVATGWDIDDERLWEAGLREERLFLREQRLQEKDTVVDILLDASGSMLEAPYTMAKVMAVRLYEAFNAQRRTAATLGIFPSVTRRGVMRLAAAHCSVKVLCEHVAPLCSSGPTPIMGALFWSAESLIHIEAARKIIFVITDGSFSASQNVQGLVDALRSQGITVVMLGIGSDSTPLGDFTEKVASVEEGPAAAVRLLKRLAKTAA